MTPGWTGASLAALLVASMLAVPEAHAVFEGVLKPGMPTTITLAAQGNNATATVLTAKRSRLSVLGILTALPFNMTQLAKTLPNVDRVINQRESTSPR